MSTKKKTKREQAADFKKKQAAKLKKAKTPSKDAKTGTKKKTSKGNDPDKQIPRADSKVSEETAANRKRIERAQKALSKARNFTSENLAKQLAETLLDEMKALQLPWYKTPQKQQEVIIARTAERVRNATNQAVRVLSASGHPAVICNLVSVTFKDGVRGIIAVAPGSNDLRHKLADHATCDVVLVLTDPHKFMQGLEDIKADLDQPQLPGI